MMTFLTNPYQFTSAATRVVIVVTDAGFPEVNQRYYETAPSVWTAEDGHGFFWYAPDDTTWYLTYNGAVQYGGTGFDPDDPSAAFSWFTLAGGEPVPTVTKTVEPV